METQVMVAKTFTTTTNTGCNHKNFSCIDDVIDHVIHQSVEEFTPKPSAKTIKAVRFSDEFDLHLSSDDEMSCGLPVPVPVPVAKAVPKYKRREMPVGSPRVTRARSGACAPLID